MLFMEEALRKVQAQKPNLDEGEVMKEVLRKSVGATVPGSCSWYRQQLEQLKCKARRWGLPHLFLTLTADEFSDTCFPEMDELAKLLSEFHLGLKWHDAPVECALLFHLRFKAFLRFALLKGGEEVLGNVQHYVVRYEVQQRDSLHAHVMLWVAEEEVATCGDGIVGCVPAEFDHEAQDFVPPTDEEASRLFGLVVDKQMHACRDEGCRATDDSMCKYGFPFEPQYDRRPQPASNGRRWLYYRPGHEHRNVVPYHPQLLLIWGAHLNLQKVSGTNWSFYILKYSMKAEPHGALNLDVDSAKVFGMEGLSTAQLKVLAVSA